MHPIYALFIGLLLLAVPVLRAAEATGPGRRLSWTTPDGVELVGRYQAPTRPGGRVWILMHGLGSAKEEWDSFARQLAAAGDGFLVYDARGHGESLRQRGGPLRYQDARQAGPGTLWAAMPADMSGAIRMLRDRYRIPERRVALGGASLGANVALACAAGHPDVPALLLLSPGQAYAGIASADPWRRYGARPALVAAAPGDRYAFESVRRLASVRGDAQLRLIEGKEAAHGVDLFKDRGFTDRVLDWMKGLGR